MKRTRPRTLPPEKHRDRAAYMKARYRNDPTAKLSIRTARRFVDWTGDTLASRGLTCPEVLGATLKEVIAHLATLFKEGPDGPMTWANWGHGPNKWQLDHIHPLCMFDLGIDGVKAGMHFTNLQPLWNADHTTKSIADCAMAAIDKANREATGAEPIPF